MIFFAGRAWCESLKFKVKFSKFFINTKASGNSTAVGYAGGITPNPTYKELCSGLTGHTEVVKVMFDPETIRYQDLLLLWGF
jgi:peptide methionine sulfoxide reductase MsrA